MGTSAVYKRTRKNLATFGNIKSGLYHASQLEAKSQFLVGIKILLLWRQIYQDHV